MRRYGTFLTATALVAAMGGTAAFAEMDINGPAEVPPKSYSGRQYVDSAGCVFVRAGYGGQVNWVPRVSRNKVQLCGYKPTFQNGEPVLDVARVAPVTPPAAPAQPTAKAPERVAAAPVVQAAPAVRAPVRPPVKTAVTEPVRTTSPFAPTPFVGRPMATIALTDTPPQIGLAVAPMAAPVRVAMAQPVATPVRSPAMAAPASRAGYVSPYVAGGAAPVAGLGGVPRGAVRYHNTVALPGQATGPAATPAVTIVSVQAVDVATTSCPAGISAAQRYALSDGCSVVRCGAPAADPVEFINAAAVPGLMVAGQGIGHAPASTAPLVGGNGYAIARDIPPHAAAPTAPMFGGTGYAVNYSSQAMGPAVATAMPTLPRAQDSGGGMTAQQAYAASSRYQSGAAVLSPAYAAAAPTAAGPTPYRVRASSSNYQTGPEAVTVRTASGLTTLAPLVVSTQPGPTGYSAAFDDGRLNPFRGPRTAWGDAEQAMIWTNQVPAKPVTARTPARQRIVPMQPAYVPAAGGPGYTGSASATGYSPMAAPVLRVSSKSVSVAAAPALRLAAAQPQASGPRYVQVGTFAVPGNAAAAKSRLAAAGLPSASSTTSKGLVVVLAGPFADARGALGLVRSAGFGDAILR